MKTTIQSLDFPCEIKNKLKIKTSTANLNLEFISGHIINLEKTILSDSFEINDFNNDDIIQIIPQEKGSKFEKNKFTILQIVV